MSRSKITLYIASSLDGFVATEDGGVSWLEEFRDHYEDGVAGGSYEEFFETVDCLVMGSRTYEQIVTEFADRESDGWPYGDAPTYVTTRRDLPRANEYVEFFAGDVSELASDLRETHETIWLVGGAALAQAFLRLDLVDEIRLSVVPVLLGDGVSLFGDTDTKRDLHLEDVTAYESGIVELQYAVDKNRP